MQLSMTAVVSKANEAIFDCTGGVKQRKQKSNTTKSNIENNTPLHAVQLRANGKAPRLPVRPYILKPACFHRTRRVTIQAALVVQLRANGKAPRLPVRPCILLPARKFQRGTSSVKKIYFSVFFYFDNIRVQCKPSECFGVFLGHFQNENTAVFTPLGNQITLFTKY